MTDSSFPFDAAPVEDHVEDETDGGRKPLLVLGAAVAAVALGAAGFLFLGGGDAAEEDYAVPVRAAQPPAAVVTETAPLAVVPAASTTSVGRNPFKARYVKPAVAPAPAEVEAPAPVAPQPAFTPLQPVQQPVLVVQQPAPAPAPAQTQAPAEYPITLKALTPNDTSGVTYTWTIDGKDLDVFQAQRFGKYGELTVLALESAADGPRAVLQVGDATPVRVRVGETVNVL